MASTYTVTKDTVFGDVRVQFATLSLTDGPTEVVSTGFNTVFTAQATVQTATGDGTGIIVGASGAGDIRLQSGVSGGVYRVVVYGA